MRTLALITLFFSAAAIGQMKSETEYARLPARQQGIVTYDKFRNITTVSSPNFTVLGLNGKSKLGTGVKLVLRYAGTEPTGEFQYHLEIMAADARGRTFDRTAEIIVLFDGQRLDLGVTDRDAEAKASRGLGIIFGSPVYVEQKLLVPLGGYARAAFLTASKVEVQAGSAEFMLHQPALTVFKNLLGRVR